ncbi:MAG TPA: SRPBCC domain-containing protein [Thermoplasmata archaeon]|nr:SRPBCC domain-containing protein [Thermoplasmata archaeon]
MADELLDPILIQVTIPLPQAMVFGAFADPTKVREWLAPVARIEPKVGAPYELEFTEPIAFATLGRVTHYTPDTDIGFTWRPPPLYADGIGPGESFVYVRLQDSPEGIDVTLEHSPWPSNGPGEEARSFHFHLWDERLHLLKEYLMRAAYG